MRQIKFRAWDKDNKEMFEPVIPFGDSVYKTVVIDIEEDKSYLAKFENAEIMQYTGLKDKNGKKIYEGDIVAFEDSDGGYEYQDLAVNTGIVEYGDLGFYFTNRVAVEMDYFYIKDGRCDEVEVIGNVFEDKELLNHEV